MRFIYFLSIVAVMSFHFAEGQSYLKLLRDGETSLEKIELAADRYFKKVGTDNNEYKFYQRWLYGAKMEADEQNILTPNSVYLEELHRYNKSRNISARSGVVQQTAAWSDLGPNYKNGTTGWNPGVGRITSLAFENTTHFIAGSPTGGIWKTTDSGQNWSCLTDNLSNIDVYSLAIGPNNNNTYFWGSTQGRIFKSTDGGVSWTLLNGGSLMGNSEAERVNKNEYLYITSSPITAPGNDFPIYTKDTNGFKVFGTSEITTTNDVTLNYIKKPSKAVWNYVTVLGNAQYNATGSVDFELHPSEETELVIKILALAGLMVQDIGIYQVATAEEAKDVQQQKA